MSKYIAVSVSFFLGLVAATSFSAADSDQAAGSAASAPAIVTVCACESPDCGV